ncbi:MAG: Arsenite efflux ATP-binding protein ArsA [Parcubacteria group bacterium GW2011_GWA2_42_14]|nr:MAG: Arsenite efflux ATP-binding protein ArsA [Parcubacteria group bacterium GW2011_GWA2_42_14]
MGKTSMSAATALGFAKEYAKRRKNDKVLIFTTDPAPSLADSFGQKIGNEPTQIEGAKNLFAMEIDAKKVLEEFKKEYGEDILDILQEGTYLANEEAEELFSLDIPGLDEVMGLKKITDFMDSQEFGLYIVDTAPTGHTLRLLTLPELLDDWIKFLASLRWKYHAMVRQFAREERVTKADQFLLEMKKTVKKVRELLQDEKRTEFIVVTIAESMGVRETEDLISTLEKFHIPSRHIIINNIFPKEDSDFAKFKRKNQEKYINEIKKKFSNHAITEVLLQADEIQGIKSLESLGKQLFV